MTSAPDELERDEQDESAPGPASQGSGPADSAAGEDAVESAEEQAVEDDLNRLLDDVRRERDEYLDLARRAKADFENYRKRAARETADAERRGKTSLARELVPAIDNLERALRAAGIERSEVDEAFDEDEEEALGRGVALVLGQLEATLERAGVEAYDPTGERFDPTWHEALQSRPVEGAESGVVVETLERGYRLDGQVIRAARVVVSA